MAPTVSLRVRKLADTSAPRYDSQTGEPLEGPLPLAGLTIEGETPQTCTVPTSFVDRGVEEGWIEVEGENYVHRPSGPHASPWRTPPHTFRQADTIVLKCIEGDVRYTVTHQPDKYAVVDRQQAGKYEREVVDPKAEVTPEIYARGDTRVDWFYELELEG